MAQGTLAPPPAGETWSGAETPLDLVPFLGAVGAILFAAVLVSLIVRAILQQRRFRAVDVLGDAERKALAQEIAAGEERTMGEIAVVVLERSDRHPGADWLACVLTLSVGSALLLAWLPWDRPLLLLSTQLLLGIGGYAASRALPGFQRFFVREERATEMAAEQALQEFYGAGLHRTAGATGVLIFVSLFEKRAIVLGDEGIDAKLDEAHWRETAGAILDGVRRGALGAGLIEGVRRCAQVLEEHFPAEGENPSEVPDHVIVRRE